MGKTLEPGVVAVIQTFGDRINFHPHLHFLVTEGGVDEAGVFQVGGSFIVLTSIRDWIYHFFGMGDVAAKFNGT